MHESLDLLPLAEWEPARARLAQRFAELGARLHAPQFAHLVDPLVEQVGRSGFQAAGAHEGTFWLVDEAEACLEPAWNSGPRAADFVGRFKQPLAEGLISMAFVTEQSFLENDVQNNVQQSKRLDSWLQVQTQALIAVPLQLLGACRGVVSCVQLRDLATATAPPCGFAAQDLATVEATAALVARLVEYHLLRRLVGLEA